jgi:hypothetical protein
MLSRIRLFADDSMIYRQIKSQSDCLKLQEDLEAAIKWEQDWLMSFHPDKCNIMNITTKRNPIHLCRLEKVLVQELYPVGHRM